MKSRIVESILLGIVVLVSAMAQTSVAQYTIITAAGGASPDGFPATSIPISYADGIVVDKAGNLYIPHRLGARVLKVAPNGIAVTVAGNGSAGFSGDGGPATSAQLSDPYAVALDNAGNLYIADSFNNRVRKVDTSGIITTIAGSGGVGPDEAGYSGDGGPAARARLSVPYSLAADSKGNIFVADYNSVVRKVDTAGIITTVAGTGDPGYSGDGGPASQASVNFPSVAADGAGNLYLADGGNNVIRKVDSAGVITTIAGTGDADYAGDGGLASDAQFNSPYDVRLDSAGNLFIADTGNNVVRKVDTSGIVTTVAGTGDFGFAGDGGPAIAGLLGQPTAVAVDGAGNLYVVDNYNARVRLINPAGVITTFAGNGTNNAKGDNVPGTSTDIGSPYGLALDAAGNLFIADSTDFQIRKLDLTGILTAVAGNGVDGVSGNGDYTGDGGPALQAQLSAAQGVAVDAAGNLYIADTQSAVVRRVDPSGVISTVAGTGDPGFSGDGGPALAAQLDIPVDVAVDAAGNLYVTDAGNNRIRKVDVSGVITTVAGNGEAGYSGDHGAATEAQLNSPSNVAIDRTGSLYISDAFNSAIRKIDSAGIITTVAGTGEAGFSGDTLAATKAMLDEPQGVAVDADGNLYIADTLNNRVRKVTVDGIITTIAGASAPGYSGDGGPATSARLNNPSAVQVDASGNVFVADLGNDRIRLLAPTGGAACTYKLSAVSASFNASGGGASLTVTASNAACPWTAVNNAPWILVTSGSPSQGTKTVTFTVTANSNATRSGTITIAGQTFTITQLPPAGL